MGVLILGSAHAWPSARPPIDTSGNFVSFEDNEFKENKALNDQGKVKDEGTIIVTAQLNLNMSWSLTW